MPTLVPLALPDLLYVLDNLRAEDGAEISAMRYDMPDGGPDTERMAAELMSVPGFAWTALANDGEPVAVIGARPMWPGVWTVFAFGTRRWREVALTLTRHVLRYMRPAMLNAGVHLAYCFSMTKHTSACRWLERIGFTAEAHMRDFGRGREDFTYYARRG